MKFRLKKMYAAIDVSGMDGSNEKYFDYEQVNVLLSNIEKNITNIMSALSKKITVTSYQGDAQSEVENAVDSIRPYLATMEEPLKEMQKKITEVRDTYAIREKNLKSSLSGIGGKVA